MIQDGGVTDRQSSVGRQATEHNTTFGTQDSCTTPEEDSTIHHDTTTERSHSSPPVPSVTEVL